MAAQSDIRGSLIHGDTTAARVELTRPSYVSVFVFDHRGRVWLRSPSATILESTARARSSRSEQPLEAALRVSQDVLPDGMPLDDASAWSEYSNEDVGSHVLVGFTSADLAPDRGLVAWPVRVVSELLRSGSDFLSPRTASELKVAISAFESRDTQLRLSASRHPAAAHRASLGGTQVTTTRPPAEAPPDIDLRILGTCQLRCAWCWGPEHDRRGSIDGAEWASTIADLARRGTRQLIISGGEPTMSPHLRFVVDAAKSAGMSITLSTNAIRLAEFEDVVELVDDIGIPIDGSTPEMNDRMRKGSLRFGGWERAIDGVRLVQELRNQGRSKARVTIRTVLARPNLADAPRIPEALRRAGVDLAEVRLKQYQIEPFGPHFGQIDFERDWAVTAAEARACAKATNALEPSAHVELQLYEETVGRYFLVDPDGLATGTDEDDLGNPIEVAYGNVVTDRDRTLLEYKKHLRSIDRRDSKPAGVLD